MSTVQKMDTTLEASKSIMMAYTRGILFKNEISLGKRIKSHIENIKKKQLIVAYNLYK